MCISFSGFGKESKIGDQRMEKEAVATRALAWSAKSRRVCAAVAFLVRFVGFRKRFDEK